MSEKAQAPDKMVDMGYGLGDATESIFPESGILKMHGQVLEHQVQSRSGVLQVVNEEGRHRLKCLKFFGLEQFLGKLEIHQAGRQFIGNALEQIGVLRGEGN